jgi:hypothetical protein
LAIAIMATVTMVMAIGDIRGAGTAGKQQH